MRSTEGWLIKSSDRYICSTLVDVALTVEVSQIMLLRSQRAIMYSMNVLTFNLSYTLPIDEHA